MTTSTTGLARDREQRLVATFIELADTLIEDFDVVEFFAALSERIVELGLARQAGILLVDDAGDLQFVAASNERTQVIELFQVEAQQGPCQDCFRTGTPVAIAQLEDERERWPQFVPKALATGFVAVDAVPLRLRDTILGAMTLFHDRPGTIDPDDLTVVRALADVATIGLVQYQELDRAHSVETQLQHALHSRITIEQAKGVIFEQACVSMSDAVIRLRAYARGNNVKLSDVARRIVEGSLDAWDLTPRA